jgi:hypothetical protein
MGWLRWHDGTVEDAKFAVISTETGISVATVTGIWASLLEGANSYGTPGKCLKTPSLLAKTLRVTVTQMEEVIDGLVRYGCVTRNDDGITIVNWKSRQFTDASAAQRMRRYRERKRNRKGVTVTSGPFTVTDTEQNRTDSLDRGHASRANGHAVTPKAPTERRKPRKPIPDDWEPSDSCYRIGAELGFTRVEVQRRAAEFLAYWQSRGDLKSDWDKAFIVRLHFLAEKRIAEQQSPQPPRSTIP